MKRPMKTKLSGSGKYLALTGALICGLITLGSWGLRADTSAPFFVDLPNSESPNLPTGQAHVDVVFAIDCSGSMGPVIETAKRKVWTIVNEIAKAKPAPVLRIGLIGYGDSDHTFREFPLSDDLDTVYKNLMTFKDEGWSEEYVGLAVHKATTEMAWSDSVSTTLKVIYVLGNETARQGPEQFDYAKTSPFAATKNIIVNAIYCNAGGSSSTAMNINPPNAAANPATPSVKHAPGTPQVQQFRSVQPALARAAPLDGEIATWMEMASLGKGQFLEINGDGGTVNIPTPYDAELIKLNNELNATYIPYGAAGKAGIANQATQDANASSVGGASTMAYRAQSKGSSLYNNRGWDLVDASRDKEFDWSKVKTEDLPESLKGKTLEERQKIVAQNAARRAELQTQIHAVGDKREAYLLTEIKKQNLDNKNAFDEQVKRSINQQGQAKGFQF
jgi:hypothetical protein